jgi:dTDP-4-amino-4,6-dideoxygalactose transaminase
MLSMTTQTLSQDAVARAFAQPLHVGRPNVGSAVELQRRVLEILESRWLSNGAVVREFEQRIAQLVGVRHCIAVCNATAGLEVVYRAAGFSGEVILPANTFVATAHALAWQGITPVFCEIDPATHNIDPDQVERLITPRTTGIVGVHLWGRPCLVREPEEIATRHGLGLVFDAAHALGSSLGGRMIGNFGLAEVFSFHATKFVGCGEGGAIVTSDDELAARIRRMINFGISGCDQVSGLGINGKMSEVAAAVGLTALDAMPDFVATNMRNQRCYQQAIAGIPGIVPIEFDDRERNNFQYVVLEVDEENCPLTRDQWLQVLHSRNVLARRYFFPGVHRMQPYASRDPAEAERLPRTDRLLRRVLVLPSGTAVAPADIDVIGAIFRDAIQAASELSRQLPAALPLPTNPLAGD